MRMLGGVVAVLLLSSMAHAEVLCVRFKKDGTLTGAIKVRNECKRREVQVDGPMLGLCCDASTTTSTSTTTTIDTGFTTLTTTAPTLTTTTTFPPGTTTTVPPGTTTTFPPGTTTTSTPVFTTTSTIVTTTVTSTVVTSSTIATTTSTSSTSTSTSTSNSTSTSTVTTTSLDCPSITTTTIVVNNCGGNPPFCNGFCADGSSCYAAGGIECSCGGPPLPCGLKPDGTCGGTCPGGQQCGQVPILGTDGCPESYGCACVTP